MALPVFSLGTVSPTKRHGQRHHDGRAEALRCARADQQPERGSHAAQDRGCCEEQDAGEQQRRRPVMSLQPPDADDQRGDGEEIGQHDPLYRLERGAERLRQGSAGPTLAMLVPSEDSSMDNERLRSAQRTEGVRSPLTAAAFACAAMIGFKTGSLIWRLPHRGFRKPRLTA